MFSATFPDDIQTTAQDFLNDYLFLTTGMVGGACSDVQQEFYEVAKVRQEGEARGIDAGSSWGSKGEDIDFCPGNLVVKALSTYLNLFSYFRRRMPISWPVTCARRDFPPPASTVTGSRGRGKWPFTISVWAVSTFWFLLQ